MILLTKQESWGCAEQQRLHQVNIKAALAAAPPLLLLLPPPSFAAAAAAGRLTSLMSMPWSKR
jgi:hypothetical protein